jgi:hypothetical protein
MKSVYMFAILAAAVSTSAMAKDLKQNQPANSPTVSATQMSDAEMDRVTAGANPGDSAGLGIGTACLAGGTCEYPSVGPFDHHFLVTPGSGTGTVSKP